MSGHSNHLINRNAEYECSGDEASLRVPSELTGGSFDGGATLLDDELDA